jgi:glycosyltransferase involved in cell wall biosynthesis
MQIRLSAVIITFNEEHNIGRCLESLRGVADEIVVVDSFSKDRTEEICRSFGVKWVQHAFEGHIQQKNWAITQASHPHVLSLDADEALDETLRKSIVEVKQNWVADGYSMNRLTNYCGSWIRHSGWYPDVKLRLWDSRKGQWTGRNPHDRYELQPGCSTQHLAGDILHYSYYTVVEHWKQLDYFSTISAKAMLEEGKRATWLDAVVHAGWKYFRALVLKTAFLDGWAGWKIARLSSIEVWRKYRKLSAMQKANPKP